MLAGVPIPAAAAECGFNSTAVFGKSFKSQTGLSPTKWQIKKGVRTETRVRVERAEALLATGEHTITAVAQMLGYSSPKALAQAFYRVHGIAPSDWLRSSRRRPADRNPPQV